MISRPPVTDDIALNTWLREVETEFNKQMKTLTVPVTSLGTGNYMLHGKHPSSQLQAGELAYFGFVIPIGIREFREVVVRFIPTTTGTVTLIANLSYGPFGGDENATTKTKTVTDQAATDDQISEMDITSIFTDQVEGDQVALEIELDAATTTTDIHVLSLVIKYF